MPAPRNVPRLPEPGLYRVKTNVHNPGRDRRRRYGIEAVDTVRAGTLVRVGPATVCVARGIYAGPGDAIYPSLVEALEPHPVVTLFEYRKAYDVYDNELVDVLDRLVSLGEVSLLRIDQIRADLDDEADAGGDKP